MINAFDYTDAGIVGKYSHYTYIQGHGVLGIRDPGMENRYVETFPTSSVMIRREIMDVVQFDAAAKDPFPILFRDCVREGIRLYSADRFNFVNTYNLSEEDRVWKPEELLIQCSNLTSVSRCQVYVTI